MSFRPSGVVLWGTGNASLIDSGSDRGAGKRILKILKDGSFLVNRHSDADHIGGNAFLQRHGTPFIYDIRAFLEGYT